MSAPPVSLARPGAKPTTAPGYPPQPYPQAGGQPPSQYGAPPAGQYGAPPPGQYGAPPTQPGAPSQYGAPPAGQYGQQPGQYPPASQPGAPSQYGAPPTQQPYGAPPTGQYGQPPAGQYGAPPGGQYGQPPTGQYPPSAAPSQYGAPPAGQYGAPPPAGQYGAPPAGQYGAQPVMGMAPGAAPTMGAVPGQPGQPGVISLVKNQNMSLTKIAPNLRHARIGLGWDVRQSPGAPFDLDTSVFLLNAAGKIRMPQDFIFYNNRQSVDGSVVHHGDNLTGAGEGDDEQVSVDLTRVPPDVQRIIVICSIYDAEQRQQNFGMVQRAFIRIVDQDTNQEIVRYDLSEEACMWNTMSFGELYLLDGVLFVSQGAHVGCAAHRVLYRYGNEWKFKALGDGRQGGLRGMGAEFGIALA